MEPNKNGPRDDFPGALTSWCTRWDCHRNVCWWPTSDRAGPILKRLISSRDTYCCLPNFGRCGRSQDRVSVNYPLVESLYPAEWMAEKQFRTVDQPSWHRRHRPKLGRQQ